MICICVNLGQMSIFVCIALPLDTNTCTSMSLGHRHLCTLTSPSGEDMVHSHVILTHTDLQSLYFRKHTHTLIAILDTQIYTNITLSHTSTLTSHTDTDTYLHSTQGHKQSYSQNFLTRTYFINLHTLGHRRLLSQHSRNQTPTLTDIHT